MKTVPHFTPPVEACTLTAVQRATPKRCGGVLGAEEKCFVKKTVLRGSRRKLRVLLPKTAQKCRTQSDSASKNVSREVIIQLI